MTDQTVKKIDICAEIEHKREMSSHLISRLLIGVVLVAAHPNETRSNDFGAVFDPNYRAALAPHLNPVTVAIIDDAFDASHPELEGRIAVAAPETQGEHGLWLAGLIAGNTHGLSPNALVRSEPLSHRPGSVLDADAEIASAVDRAVQSGVRVLNLSLGRRMYPARLSESLERAIAQGVVVVVAAGNDGANRDLSPMYPASFDLPGLITVTAHDDRGCVPLTLRESAFSSSPAYGPLTVDIATRAEDLLTTGPNGTIVRPYPGTSLSAALVSGAVATLLGYAPDLLPHEIEDLIVRTAEPLRDCGISGVKPHQIRSRGILSLSNAFEALVPSQLHRELP